MWLKQLSTVLQSFLLLSAIKEEREREISMKGIRIQMGMLLGRGGRPVEWWRGRYEEDGGGGGGVEISRLPFVSLFLLTRLSWICIRARQSCVLRCASKLISNYELINRCDNYVILLEKIIIFISYENVIFMTRHFAIFHLYLTFQIHADMYLL